MKEIKENLGKLACMVNNMREHVKSLKGMGFGLKQAENYLACLEMLQNYYKNINDDDDDKYSKNHYEEE